MNHRLPTKVSVNEWNEKMKKYNNEPLTINEIEFFQKLKGENTNLIDIELPISKNNVFYMYLYSAPHILFGGRNITISKLEDEWTLLKIEWLVNIIIDLSVINGMKSWDI